MKLSSYLSEAPVVGFQRMNPTSNDSEVDNLETDGEQDQPKEYDDDESQPFDLSRLTSSDDGEDDPDRQGTIRTVPKAHLIYKRRDKQNLFTELWIYKQDFTSRISTEIYDAILAGTDIPKGRQTSLDGTQSVEVWEIGPPENTLTYVEIKGLTY